jgi:hypothetical protein
MLEPSKYMALQLHGRVTLDKYTKRTEEVQRMN